jgi:5-methylcytosine-specific restriction endonuclease McrA
MSRRRARVANVEVALTFDEWVAILEEYKYRCAYCGREFSRRLRPTQDHKIPLCRGGKHVRDNIVPACMRCNQVKQARTPAEAFGLLFD